MSLELFTNFTGEHGYVDLVKTIVTTGENRNNERTGVGTKSIFGATWGCDLQKEFPLFSIREINWRAAIDELLWFIQGNSSAEWFQKQGHKYWDPWLKQRLNGKKDFAGRIYGVQWRNWLSSSSRKTYLKSTDQLHHLLKRLKNDPESRRHVVTAWNPGELDQMCLPPCHMIWQVYVRQGGFLDLVMYQRSADMILGVPHDIVMYATLCHILAHEVGLKVGTLRIMFGDTHVYNNHIEYVMENWFKSHPGIAYSSTLDSAVAEHTFIKKHKPIFILDDSAQQKIEKNDLPLLRYTPECFAIQNYDPYPSPKLKVAI